MKSGPSAPASKNSSRCQRSIPYRANPVFQFRGQNSFWRNSVKPEVVRAMNFAACSADTDQTHLTRPFDWLNLEKEHDNEHHKRRVASISSLAAIKSRRLYVRRQSTQ